MRVLQGGPARTPDIARGRLLGLVQEQAVETAAAAEERVGLLEGEEAIVVGDAKGVDGVLVRGSHCWGRADGGDGESTGYLSSCYG